MNRCHQCGAPLRASAKFCAACGAPVNIAVDAPLVRVCQKCGADLEKHAQFCIHCGSLRQIDVVPSDEDFLPQLAEPGTPYQPKYARPRRLRVPLIVLAAAVVLGLVLLFGLHR